MHLSSSNTLSNPLFANAWEKRFAHGDDFAQTMVIEKGDNHCSIPKTSDMLPGFDQSATLTQMLNKWYESDNMISALVSNPVIVCFDQRLSHLALRHQSISWQLNLFKCPANTYKFGKLTDDASMAAHAPEAPSLKCELQGCICCQMGHGMQRHIRSTCYPPFLPRKQSLCPGFFRNCVFPHVCACWKFFLPKQYLKTLLKWKSKLTRPKVRKIRV